MTPRILSLDTTTEFGSLALLEGQQLAEEVLLHSPDGFGHVLFGQLTRLLDRHGWKLDAIDCFAAAAGPGSFTGVRVGLAAVQGLAEAAGKKVAAVSNLQALASLGSAPLRAAFVDARRGEVYGSLYGAKGDIARPELAAPFPVWIDSLPDGDVEFVTTDFTPFQAALEASRFAGSVRTQAPRALAPAIGRIAAQWFREGRCVDPAAVDANYVRRSDAELKFKEPNE